MLWILDPYTITSNHAVDLTIHFQEKHFILSNDCIRGDHDFTQQCRADLLFWLISTQTLNFINYAHTMYRPRG